MVYIEFDGNLVDIQKPLISDSRKVLKGSIFFLLVNNLQYFIEALNRGADVICVDISFMHRLVDYDDKINILGFHNIRLAYSFFLAEKNAPFPANIIGVTGTNGKTSIVNMCRELLYEQNYSAASIGTLGAFIGRDKIEDLSYTTPPSEYIYEMCSNMQKKGVNYLFQELSSHALNQYRFHHAKLDVAVFTNISHEHLDYHKDMQSYFLAKVKIFSDLLKSGGYAVVNSDVEVYDDLIANIPEKMNIIEYGYKAKDIMILDSNMLPDGQIIKIKFVKSNKICDYFVPLLGNFQPYNIACIFAVAEALKINIEHSIKTLKPLDGRMQSIYCKNKNRHVIVDYAHTPDALLKSIESIKLHFQNKKILCIFGCGGERDKEKRRIMGKISSLNSDYTIITDDNPRNEASEVIRKDIISGFKNDNFIEIPDRECAIKYAIDKFDDNWVTLIAGKGHEKYQIIKNDKKYFSDFECASKILASL